MRKTLADFLVEKARADDKVIFLTGDLGFQVFEKFQMEFPNFKLSDFNENLIETVRFYIS